MKAAVHHRFGGPDVVSIADIDKPKPRRDEVLVRIHATTVTTADWRFRSSTFGPSLWLIGRAMAGFIRPRMPVLGMEFSGVVEACGADVRRFKPGDRVFGLGNGGAHAEWMTMKAEGAIALMPVGLSFEDAAAIPFGGTTALVYLGDFARIEAGQRLLVLGGSGQTGSWFVQIGKMLGAHVTATASADKADWVFGLGADRVIDHRADNALDGRSSYDVIIDTAGIADFFAARPALTPTGRYLPLVMGIGDAALNVVTALLRGRRVLARVVTVSRDDLAILGKEVAAGRLVAPVGARFSLDQIVEAHRLVDAGSKRGAALVVVRPDEAPSQAQAA